MVRNHARLEVESKLTYNRVLVEIRKRPGINEDTFIALLHKNLGYSERKIRGILRSCYANQDLTLRNGSIYTDLDDATRDAEKICSKCGKEGYGEYKKPIAIKRSACVWRYTVLKFRHYASGKRWDCYIRMLGRRLAPTQKEIDDEDKLLKAVRQGKLPV
jgi:hypothetical protein